MHLSMWQSPLAGQQLVAVVVVLLEPLEPQTKTRAQTSTSRTRSFNWIWKGTKRKTQRYIGKSRSFFFLFPSEERESLGKRRIL